jgi:hypothetical protein
MTFDHRVATGREAGSFLNELRNRMLSYAPMKSQLSSTAVTETQRIASAPVSCDTCGIGYESYTQEFGRQANMMARFNQDGSLVGICHRCYDGWA